LFRSLNTVLFFYVLAGVVLFGSAGRLDLPFFWAYLLLVVLSSIFGLILLSRRSASLLNERRKPGPGEQDRVFRPASIVCSLAYWSIAGLDAGRFHWSRHFPASLQFFGLLLAAGGFWFAAWAMLENSFFSSAVRLQSDRAQTVVTSGPYRFIRHPGYAGTSLFMVGSSLSLGSWWALLPIVLILALIFRRTLIEDALLRHGLPNYSDYANVVRFRLIPHIW
jgi:protein-S-isoprenylcysteine O-methyltransferase Ste14